MSANGLSITGGTTIALSANTIYEITAVVQIYNTAAEAYTFMFYNETDAIILMVIRCILASQEMTGIIITK